MKYVHAHAPQVCIGDYGCIPKVSKQLIDCLSTITGAHLSVSLYEMQILIKCLLEFRDLIQFKHIMHTIV